MAILNLTYFSNALRRQTHMTALVPVEEFGLAPGMPVPDKTKPFRTLVLLHGFSGCDTDWLRGSRIDELALMHNVAVLFPCAENSFYINDTARDAMYETLVCQETLEIGRKLFPLSHRREDTTIGGYSMGGYGALRCGLKNNDLFGNVIALSSALITDQIGKGEMKKDNPMATAAYYEHVFGPAEQVTGSDLDPKALAKAAKEGNGKGPAPELFIACGDEDFLIEPNRSFSAYLDSIGYAHKFFVSPGVHNWKFWDEYIEKAMIWLDQKSEVGAGAASR